MFRALMRRPLLAIPFALAANALAAELTARFGPAALDACSCKTLTNCCCATLAGGRTYNGCAGSAQRVGHFCAYASGGARNEHNLTLQRKSIVHICH